MSTDKIEPGDFVQVNMNAAGMNLCQGTVLNVPRATGDSWVIKDKRGNLHYISEPVSVFRAATP